VSARDCDGVLRRRVAAGWTFCGDPRSVARARARVRAALDGHVPAAVVADAVLAASELATNAVRHTDSGGKPDGRYALAVSVLAGPAARVRVAVVDQGSAGVPRIGSAEAMTDPDAFGGRGLGALARLGSVGWEDVPPGRRVWADLPCDEPYGGAR
jgi:anti-sigma regulatory factor (Ser/Thr protein kinase)